MATDNASPSRQAGYARHLAPRNTFGNNLSVRSSGTATPSQGSHTQTITPGRSSRSISPETLVLRLRGSQEPTPEVEENQGEPSTGNNRRRRIQWAEDVVDNEGLGRKKSKVCCIYHKDREFGESSSEDSSSSSDSDSDTGSSSGADDGSARPVGGGKRSKKGRGRRKQNHEHGDDCDHNHGGSDRRQPSPNAYEKMPKYDVKPLNGVGVVSDGGRSVLF